MRLNYPNLTDQDHADRRAAVDAVISKGGTLRDFADLIEVSPPGALKWLRRYAPEHHRALVGDRVANAMCPHKALVRLLLIKSAEGIPYGRERLADALGLSLGALYAFLTRWAPDGLDAAIADLMPDDDEAAHG